MAVQNPNEIANGVPRKYDRRSHTQLRRDEAPMTLSQASYLMTLCEEAGEILDDSLTFTEAERLIEQLEDVTGRAGRVHGSEPSVATPPHAR